MYSGTGVEKTEDDALLKIKARNEAEARGKIEAGDLAFASFSRFNFVEPRGVEPLSKPIL